MPPANKGFRAHQPAVVEADLRLVEKFERFLVDCALHEQLERQAGFKFIPDGMLEENGAATAGGLGSVQRQIGVAKEFVRRRAMVRIDRHANAGVDAKLTLTDGERDFSECDSIFDPTVFSPVLSRRAR